MGRHRRLRARSGEEWKRDDRHRRRRRHRAVRRIYRHRLPPANLSAVSNLLVVDAGNTNVVLGIYRDDRLIDSWRLATARDRTADEYGILTRQLLNGTLKGRLDGAIVGSVVPPLNGAIAEMIRRYFDVEALF